MSGTFNTGIIVMPPFTDIASNKLNLSYRASDANLIFYLLYFDRVSVCPLNLHFIETSTILERNLFHQQIVQALIRKEVKTGSSLEKLFTEFASSAFDSSNHGSNGEWAIAPPPELQLSGVSGPVNSLFLSLRNCLPIPNIDASIEDILSFKLSHAAELASFHSVIDKLYFGLIGCASQEDVDRII